MVITGAVTFSEGFWVIPAAPFFLPEGLEKVVGQLSFGVSDGQNSVFYGVTVLSLLVMLSAIHWSTFAALSQSGKPAAGVRFLLALGALGALMGVPPLVISPVSAVPAEAGDRRAILTAALLFGLALFAEPLIAAIADFPAMVVPVLVGSGFLLLLAALQDCPLSENALERRAEVLAISALVLLLPLTGNFATALGTALIGYTLFMGMAGRVRQVAGIVWFISGIFALYYVYGSMF
jgi:AGZA family xanthine/uracil permease-like MFS transporter